MGRKFIAERKREGSRKPGGDTPKPRKDDGADEGSPTLTEGLTLFVRAKEAEGVRASTVREYIRHIGYLNDYLENHVGILAPTVGDLSAEVIRGYITYLLAEKPRYEGVSGRTDTFVGLSPNTVNIRLRTLKTMCRFWHAEGYAPENPMGSVKPVLTDEDDEVEGLSEGEVELVLNAMDDSQFAGWRDKVLVLLLLDTGLRINEATGLTSERIDYRTLTLTVPSQVAKNRKYREVPVSREVAKLLRELHEESIGYFGEAEQVFNNAYGEPFTTDAFRKRLNRLKKRIGLPKLHPHQFRHTFARDYLLNGGDLFTLQKILDHADIKTTRKYVQMNAQHIRQQHTKHSPVRKYMRRR